MSRLTSSAGTLVAKARRSFFSTYIAPVFPRRVDDEDLPERIRQELLIEEKKGDILISIVQVILIAIFVGLYSISRKTSPVQAPFSPVPWALAIYSFFAFAKFLLACRDRLSNSIQIASIFVDMALLLGLIWSFHLQYGQSAAFYLKAPTLLYVFIFIALRSLRFDVKFVLMSGFAAAAGWLALVGYAVWHSDGPAPITRDYVEYMTSSSILIGAEIDKVVSILIVTAIIAVSISRTRSLIFHAATERAAAHDLKRFFDPTTALKIVQSEGLLRPGYGQRRSAAILFVDLRGFTKLSQDTEAGVLMRLLAEYQARLVPIIRSHGGNIDKFLGDGILASFGASNPSPTFAADALRALERTVDAANGWISEKKTQGIQILGFGAAVATGTILFGCVGDESRLEFTVIGDAVNLAAKLEKHTKIENASAIATADAVAIAQLQGYVPSRGPGIRKRADIAGVIGPVDIEIVRR